MLWPDEMYPGASCLSKEMHRKERERHSFESSNPSGRDSFSEIERSNAAIGCDTIRLPPIVGARAGIRNPDHYHPRAASVACVGKGGV